jgi:phosphatidylglycerophosphate synthase
MEHAERARTHATGERRPIAARELALSRAAARWLASRGASADAISLAGLTAAVAAGLALALATPAAWAWGAAALLVELRLVCNMLDGMVAIERGIASRRGEIYNEVPDRLADAAVLIGLGYADGGAPWLGYLAALTALFTAYVRAFGSALGPPADFSGPMAKPHRMHTVAVVALLCAVAEVAGWRTDDLLLSLGLPALGLAVIAAGSGLTATRRLLRLAHALR